MGFFRRRSVARLRARADVEARAVRSCLQGGEVMSGLDHSYRHEQIVRRLGRADPSPHHAMVLAALFYNRAALLDAVGSGTAAVAAAQEAVDRYEVLDPLRGAAGQVAEQMRAARASSTTVEVERFIAQSADARGRLARLLATYEGADAAAAVHRYGASAVETYEALARTGDAFGEDDVARIRRQYDEAQRYLG